MTDPTPWRELSGDAEPKEARRLLAEAARDETWPEAERRRVWEELAQKASPQERPRRWVWAVPAVAAMASVVVLAAWLAGRPPGPPRGWHRVELEGLATVDLSPGADFDPRPGGAQQGERRVQLKAGTARLRVAHQQPGHSFVVATPELRVVVVGTRFTVQVEAGRTSVAVQEGRVRVERNDREALVDPAEAIDSTDPRLAPTPPAGPPDCAAEPTLTQRKACYERVGAGDDLAAQNALFALGLIARDEEHQGSRALEYWRESERRFGKGTLRPELALAILKELVAEGRRAEALVETERFAARHPSDPRAGEVALVRADLLCAEPRRLRDARAAYRAALAGAQAPGRQEEVLFARAGCESRRGAPASVRDAARAYLKAFPDGSHADEMHRLAR